MHNVIFHALPSSIPPFLILSLIFLSYLSLLLMHLARIPPHLLTLLVPYLSSHGKCHTNSDDMLRLVKYLVRSSGKNYGE